MASYTGDKNAGQHDFHGSCAPREDGNDRHLWAETFTLGIFRVEKSANGKGLIRGKVFMRVKGLTSRPKVAYKRAREICAKLDTGMSADCFKKLEIAVKG